MGVDHLTFIACGVVVDGSIEVDTNAVEEAGFESARANYYDRGSDTFIYLPETRISVRSHRKLDSSDDSDNEDEDEEEEESDEEKEQGENAAEDKEEGEEIENKDKEYKEEKDEEDSKDDEPQDKNKGNDKKRKRVDGAEPGLKQRSEKKRAREALRKFVLDRGYVQKAYAAYPSRTVFTSVC